jgi:predicted PurR-regulated permease PerM
MSDVDTFTPSDVPLTGDVIVQAVPVTREVAPMRRRRDVVTISLVCLLTLACFYTLYFARDIFLPMAMACILKLLLNPGVRVMAKARIPPALGAFIVLLGFLVLVSGVGFALAAPASSWLGKAPQYLPVMREKLKFLAVPLGNVQHSLEQVEKVASPAPPSQSESTVVLRGPTLTEFLFSGTRSVLTTLATMLILLYFLLAAGDIFLRRLVEVLPRLADKKHAVEMTRQIEKDISTYLLTITVINAGLGTLTGAALWALGMPDPLLWGTLVFVLNYLPYLGPFVGGVVLSIAAIMSFPTVEQALLAPGVYLGLVVVEGQFFTPMVVARRLTLNPVALFVSLIIWGWLWGVPGALLAVPMIATFKIVCDHIEPLAPIGHFLGD